MHRTTILMAALGGLLLAGQAHAQEGHRLHGPGGPGHGPFAILHGITLDSTQKQSVHQIMHSSWATLRPQMAAIRQLRQQIEATLLAPGPLDTATLSTLETQLTSAEASAGQTRLQAMEAIRNVLTPAQLSQAASTYAQMESLREQEHAVMQHGNNAATE